VHSFFARTARSSAQDEIDAEKLGDAAQKLWGHPSQESLNPKTLEKAG
jgi:hypothetical protein